jgi:outer membrane receptor protein involved in Fe transport
VVEGTNLGNVTNEDGSYFVNNVPVGLERLTAQYLGYQTTTQEQRILAGQTMTVDFQLSSEVVQAEGIVAMIEREPLVVRDNTISKTRFTAEETRGLPVDDLESVIELGAGVYENAVGCGLGVGLIDAFLQGSCGFIVRGGRAAESATFVDGVLITDFNSQTNTTSVSTFAVEETDVITGGFNAEWGHAQSGIINIVTREGGREYHGNVRFTTDEMSNAIGQGYGYNNFQASLGGPILPDKLTAYGSFEATGADDFFPTAASFNPATGNQEDNSGSTEEILPGNRGDRTLGGQADCVPAEGREGDGDIPVLAGPVREPSARQWPEPVPVAYGHARQDPRRHPGVRPADLPDRSAEPEPPGPRSLSPDEVLRGHSADCGYGRGLRGSLRPGRLWLGVLR